MESKYNFNIDTLDNLEILDKSIINNQSQIKVYEDHFYVDFNLPSKILWGKYNFGVDPFNLNNASDWYGDYYAWGEIKTKKCYSWETYTRHSNGKFEMLDEPLVKNVFYKYVPYGKKKYWAKDKLPDGLKELERVDDIVALTLGNNFKIPSVNDVYELRNYTNQTWEYNYNGIKGLNGMKCSSKDDDSICIFFPAAGFYQKDIVKHTGDISRITTSTLDKQYPYLRNILNMTRFGLKVLNTSQRYIGINVRAIKLNNE